MAATPGTVTFEGTTYNVSTSFGFASFYRCNFRSDYDVMIRFHRTEKSAQKGTWDSKEMRESWDYLGCTEVQR